MLGILSGLNWAMTALYVGLLILIGVMGGEKLPFEMFAMLGMVLMLMALPSAYLGYSIEQGRGRVMQTIFAVLALCNFPLGTAYGVFALWVCWSAEVEVFDQGGVEAAPPRSERSADRSVAREEDQEVTSPRPARTPYAIALQLKNSGLRAGDIQERLHGEGLTSEEIETLMKSLNLTFSRVKQRHLEEFS